MKIEKQLHEERAKRINELTAKMEAYGSYNDHLKKTNELKGWLIFWLTFLLIVMTFIAGGRK